MEPEMSFFQIANAYKNIQEPCLTAFPYKRSEQIMWKWFESLENNAALEV
jgi:hypothetical protein